MLACNFKKDAAMYQKCFEEFGDLKTAVVISAPDMREGNDDIDESTDDLVISYWNKMMSQYGMRIITENYKNRKSNISYPEKIKGNVHAQDFYWVITVWLDDVTDINENIDLISDITLKISEIIKENDTVDCDGVFIKLTVKNTDDIELKKKVMDEWIRCQFETTVNKICREIYPKFQKYGVQFLKIKFRKMVSRWGKLSIQKRLRNI